MSITSATRASCTLAFTLAFTLVTNACAARHPLDNPGRVAVTAPLLVEGAALDSAIAMHAGAGARNIVLDTMYAIPRTAPGQRTTARRPIDRSEALTHGRPLRLGGVPRHDEAGILLSPPQLAGDSASITVTWLGRASQGPHAAYETREYRLRRDPADNSWHIVAQRSLGTS